MKLKMIMAVSAAVLMLFSTAAAFGEKEDKYKDDLQRVDFIHYAKNTEHAKQKVPTCYSLMGVKWVSRPVSYAINPTNPDGLSEAFVTGTLSSAAEAWDAATSEELFNNNYSVDYTAQYGVQDYKNSIVFGDYSDPNAIAVTSIWYSRKTRQIVEFDMIMNTKFVWGDAETDPTVMDVLNIATHEFGHGVGLDDIYSSSCTAVTMYGYSYEGDIDKRTLEQPDITGLQSMYGA